MQIKVRYAPSPTGNPHVGNIRTALFTYLYARANKGEFLVRIEDTDKKREVKESYTAILDSLKWLGLKWDQEPILQSNRVELYKEHAQKLVENKAAYEQEGAIFFKTKKDGVTGWTDLVGDKRIEFQNSTQEDFVILKSDGFPTYHLASVVDDHLMGITTVSRGEDWISSTPKHIMLYSAFNWNQPQFAHFPNILATDRSKLSKRHGAIGVLDFKKEGFLSEAIINYLALLGWTPPSGKEILTIEEMIREFDLKDINIAPAIFDVRKLEWMNGEYIRRRTDDELLRDLEEFLVDHPVKERIAPLVPLVKERMRKLSDFIPLTDFLFEEPEYEKSIFEKILNKTELDLKKVIEEIIVVLESLRKPYDAESFEVEFRKLGEKLNLSATQIFQMVRVCVSGQLVTPPLFECVRILGEEKTINRVKRLLTSEIV